jgi:hypothetical protein
VSSLLGAAETYPGAITHSIVMPGISYTGIAAEEPIESWPPSPTVIELDWTWASDAANQDIKEHEMASTKLQDRPVPLWLGGSVVLIIFAVFAWGFSSLNTSVSNVNGSLMDFHKEAHSDIQGVQSDIKSLTETSHTDAMATNQQIGDLSKQIAITNAHLEDLTKTRGKR